MILDSEDVGEGDEVPDHEGPVCGGEEVGVGLPDLHALDEGVVGVDVGETIHGLQVPNLEVLVGGRVEAVAAARHCTDLGGVGLCLGGLALPLLALGHCGAFTLRKGLHAGHSLVSWLNGLLHFFSGHP